MKLTSGKILPLLLPFLHRFTWGHNNKPWIAEAGTREIRKFLIFFIHEFLSSRLNFFPALQLPVVSG